MNDALTVETNGAVVMGEKQARSFALAMLPEIKKYVAAHRAEFETWKRGKNDGKCA